MTGDTDASGNNKANAAVIMRSQPNSAVMVVGKRLSSSRKFSAIQVSAAVLDWLTTMLVAALSNVSSESTVIVANTLQNMLATITTATNQPAVGTNSGLCLNRQICQNSWITGFM